MRTFNSAAVCRTAGITFRQLDYWCRTGVILPPDTSAAGRAARGSGSARVFSELELNVVAIVARLARLGAGTDVMGEVAVTLRMLWEMDELRGIVYIDTAGNIFAEPCASCYCVDLDAATEQIR